MGSIKMKAVTRKKYGMPSVLKIKEIDIPTPKNNEILIRVYAATVNRTDCAILTGKPLIMKFFTGLFSPKFSITGTDFAGQIEAVGENVSAFKVGDSVFGFDDLGLASHAEYMTISEEKALAVIPKNLTYEEAAASIEGAHYAFNFLNKVDLKKGDKVIINGATGAIGSSLVQFVKYFEAEVTAVANTKNIELIKSIGADRVIDYMKEDFTKDNQKYDLVLDAVGKSSFNKSKDLLKKNGIYISSEPGYMLQNIFLALITPIIGVKKVIFPIAKDIKSSMIFIKKLIEEEKFKAVIDRKYSLDKIEEAYNYVMSGQKTGNVIITI